MRLNCTKIALMAALLGLAGGASAQTTEPTPVPTVPSTVSQAFHNAATHYGKIQTGALRVTKSASGEITTNAIAAQYTLGWNIVHVVNCLVFPSGSYWWLYAYTDSGSVYFTAVPAVQTSLAPQCSTGNYTGFYVVSSGGEWTQLYTWSYK